jgi:hypothetical protein
MMMMMMMMSFRSMEQETSKLNRRKLPDIHTNCLQRPNSKMSCSVSSVMTMALLPECHFFKTERPNKFPVWV